MIAGIGTDIVAVARIERALARNGRFAEKVLTETEQAIYNGLAKSRGAYVAKRFAAKEAFFKALGQPPSEANTWDQLAVLNDDAGKPHLEFGPLLADLLRRQGITRWHVSLSDERAYALAYVVLEKE